jgi:RNA-directed DNA polymerase
MTKLNQKWYNTNWDKISKYVSKKPTKELMVVCKNNDQKLLFLQEKVIIAFKGRALAVKQIVTNDGKKTPSLDKITWNSFRLKAPII